MSAPKQRSLFQPARLLCGRRSLRSWVSSRQRVTTCYKLCHSMSQLNLEFSHLVFGCFKWSSKGSIFRCQSTWFYKILYLVCPCAISSVLSGSHGEAEPAGACVAHRFDTSREEKRKPRAQADLPRDGWEFTAFGRVRESSIWPHFVKWGSWMDVFLLLE